MDTPILVALITGILGVLAGAIGIILNILLRARVAEIDSAAQRKLNRLNKGLDSAEQLMSALGDLDSAMRHLVFQVETTGITTDNFSEAVGPVAKAADKVRQYSFPASLYWGDEVVELCGQIYSMCQQFSFEDVRKEAHPKKVHQRLAEISMQLGKIMARHYLRGEPSGLDGTA